MLAMFKLESPSTVENFDTMPETFLFEIQRRVPSLGIGLSVTVFGKFTELTMFPFSRKARSWSTAMSAQFSSASGVDAPRCGIQIVFGAFNNSSAAKSFIKQVTFPLLSASSISPLFTSPPRAIFIIRTPFFINLRDEEFIIPFVSSVCGT